jgi:dihydrodipicolinate synthase/N-acetylneuraminate lyase
MIKAAQSESSSENRELVSIGSSSEKAGSAHVGTAAPRNPAEQGSASSVDSSRAGIKTRQKEVGFQVLAGAAQRLLPALEAGAVGAVLAFAAPAPTACYEIFTAWKEGDADLARLKQQRVSGSASRVGSELGIPALKYALDLNGYYGGPPRLPLLPLTSDLKAEVEKLMSDLRN